jgi:hypothetical protein
MVIVPDRAAPALAATVNEAVPPPVPFADVVIQDTFEIAVQGQFEADAVTTTLLFAPAELTEVLEDPSPNVQTVALNIAV